MSETVTTTVEAFYLNADEENQPAKIQAADGNTYSTFQPEDHLPNRYLGDERDSKGDEVKIEYETVEKGGNTYHNIQDPGVEVVDTSPDPGQSGETVDSNGSGYVSGADRQVSIEAQGLLKVAQEAELSLSARDDGYEFDAERVRARALEYVDVLDDLKEEIAE